MSPLGRNEKGENIAEKLDRALKRLVAATVVLYVVLIGMGYYVYTVSRNNTDVLCALRTDFESRVKQGEEFLREHPQGASGFSPEQLESQLNNSKRTFEALKTIDCPAPPVIVVEDGNP